MRSHRGRSPFSWSGLLPAVRAGNDAYFSPAREPIHSSADFDLNGI
jgi:hypothetical protein